MSETYPHKPGPASFGWESVCRCGEERCKDTVTADEPPSFWGSNCPAAMAERIAAYETELSEVDQLLGRALGYPPNPDGAPGVCTGEHTPASLAMTAARRIAELEAHVRRLLDCERESAAYRGFVDRTCMGKSRAAEHAYERGECPHQLANQALRSPHAD